MKKTLFCTILLALQMPAMAQDAYDAANLATTDLNGTARYVGMGGALDALGADISTISSNPAGIGLFRHSDLRASLGLVSQQDARKFGGVNPTNLSFDQIGFVWSNRTGASSYLNFGFNYHKSRNFSQIIAASNSFADPHGFTDKDGFIGSGQNLQTVIKDQEELLNSDDDTYSQIDAMYMDLIADKKGIYPLTASSFDFTKGTKGFIGNFDFNVSGNSNNRIFWGFTVGIHAVNYESYTTYNEKLHADQLYPLGTSPEWAGISLDDRTIKGHGVDVKAGVIVRPIEESPFRIGLTIASPTWYRLKTSNNTTVYIDKNIRTCREEYEFKYSTPWAVGVSLGHTIENMLALGLSYNYTIFSSADMRYLTNSGYSGDESRSDTDMNDEIGASLRGTHTLKVGAELKPDPAFAIRIGYNFVSSPYRNNDEAYRNQKVNSPGVYYASTTDYVNWKPTHRITAGFGTKISKFSIDLAYQYQVTKGDFFPFTDGEYYDSKEYPDNDNYENRVYLENVTPATSVTFARHQALLTLGYTF